MSSGTLRRARLCPARSVLRWGAKKESLGSLTVSVQQDIKSGSPCRVRSYTEHLHIVPKFLPRHYCFRGSDTTQVVQEHQFWMAAPKPPYHYYQPTINEPCRDLAIRIHGTFRAIKAHLAHLPASKTTKKGPNHCTGRVLKIGDQLNGQQRKSAFILSTQKPGDGDFFFPEFRK